MTEKIAVLGTSYIGLPTAVLFAKAGYSVVGVDINPAVIDSLNSGVIPVAEPGLQAAFDEAMGTGRLSFSRTYVPADVFIIAVQTPWKKTEAGRSAELKYVMSAAAMLGEVIAPGNLVILESTVPPGTLRLVEAEIARVSGLSSKEFQIAHCPERIIPGNMLKELSENDRIIGARLPEVRERVKRIYSAVVTKGTIRMTDDVTAETAKLAENTFRDINIAYANALSMMAEKLGIDVFELIELANCHPRVNIHTPGVGVGGHCIAVDPWFLTEGFEEEARLVRTAREINDAKPFWVAEQVEKHAPKGKPVLVLGLTYKPDVDDLRESPSIELCHALKAKGFTVIACEPNIEREDIDGITNLSLIEGLEKCGYAVLTLAHKEFREQAELIAGTPCYDCVGLLRSRKKGNG
ncbi:nucleotide sugar dehydrogenase [Oscillospiraceae bacterium OttesenSCG-928-F05]|nr:nucleotide sugar dehydrogenase [Oscillospiraceae bacterium OttesenSCG-928-F05]